VVDDLQLTIGEAVGHVAHDLASTEGVDLTQASPSLWEARGLALHHLAGGDLDEALKVMTAAICRRVVRNPETNQPPTAARETP